MPAPLEVLALAVALAAGVGAMLALIRYGRRVWAWLRQAGRDFNVLKDTMVGSEAIMHPVRSGEVLYPARPGLAKRMDTIETTLTELVATNRRMDALEADLLGHRAWAQAEHIELDRRLAELEAARVERTVARAESAAMWTAIAADRAADPSSPESADPVAAPVEQSPPPED